MAGALRFVGTGVGDAGYLGKPMHTTSATRRNDGDQPHGVEAALYNGTTPGGSL